MNRRIYLTSYAAASFLFSSCASPATHPGIGSFGTRAGYTAEHLITGAAKLNALFDWRFGVLSFSLPAGPIVFTPVEIDGRPILTGTSK